MKSLLIALVLLPCLCFADYYSFHGQDKYVHENYFPLMRSGIFVDIGAYDGTTDSFSKFFETSLDWTGICIEPMPKAFATLERDRSCICVQGCVATKTGASQFLNVSSPHSNIEMLSGLVDKYEPNLLSRIMKEIRRFEGSCELINVKCYLINDLLEQHKINHVNFLAIDTTGSEMEILSTIDFGQVLIDVIMVQEHHEDKRIELFLASKGYELDKRIHKSLIFVHQDFKS